MEYIKYNEKYNKDMYELFSDFQKEDEFYMEHTYEQFEARVFENKEFQKDGTFLCLDGDKLVGFIGGLVRSADKENPKASGYIHTFIVKKEYRRQKMATLLFNKIDELVGDTPLLKLNNLKKFLGLKADIYAKLEYLNPAGSIKDRAALFMINDAENKGLISDGATIIEPTSGNTGIGIACLSASRGYKAILTMPDTMSKERILLLKAYGAQVILTDGKLGMKGAIDKANEIHKSTPNSIICGQFDNGANIDAHYNTTAREIYSAFIGDFDYFVAGVGSGGTISGCGKFFKEVNKKIKVVAVEPLSSPLITKGISGSHKIQGIGANFIPKNFIKEYVDEVIAISDEDSYKYCRLLAKEEGVLCGISSGASLCCAIQIAIKDVNKDKKIVVILPDTGDRYLSSGVFED